MTLELPLLDGGSFSWVLPHPAALLNVLARAPVFAEMLVERLAAVPSTFEKPWELIMYVDECSCGNLLARDPSRKCWAIYVSYKELGLEILPHESAWQVAGILRTQTAATIDGGFATAATMYLECVFGRLEGANFRHGVTVHTASGVLTIFATLGFTIGDEAALKSLWRFKGSSGFRPCGVCANVVNTRLVPALGSLVGLGVRTRRSWSSILTHH